MYLQWRPVFLSPSPKDIYGLDGVVVNGIGDCSSMIEAVFVTLAGVGVCDNHTVWMSLATPGVVPLMLHSQCTLPLTVRVTAAGASVLDSSVGYLGWSGNL